MIALAVHGPLATSELERAASLRKGPLGVETFVKDGIIAKKIVRATHGQQHHYSLIAAHPTYRQIRALLRSIAGAHGAKVARGDFPSNAPCLKDHRLLGGVLSLRALLALALAPHGEIDAQSTADIVPAHGHQPYAAQMRDFETICIVMWRRWETLRLYRLGESWSYYKPLRALFLATADAWPRFRTRVSLVDTRH